MLITCQSCRFSPLASCCDELYIGLDFLILNCSFACGGIFLSCWVWFSGILFRIFASLFVTDVSLQFSSSVCLCVCSPGFVDRLTLVL